MALTINVDPHPDHVALTLAGEVDTKSAPALLDALTKIGLPELSQLRIYADQLTFMSSAGLRALVFAKQKMPHSGQLIVVGASSDIKEVITRTGLAGAVTLVGSVAEIP
jgi:anti-anti-sigma factor